MKKDVYWMIDIATRLVRTGFRGDAALAFGEISALLADDDDDESLSTIDVTTDDDSFSIREARQRRTS